MNNRTSKGQKIEIFPKGITRGFDPKMELFPTFFLRNIGQENVFYDILEQKDSILGNKNKRSTQLKNYHFSKRVNPWFWSKNGHFFNFFLRNIGQENVSYNILEQKNDFLG